MGHLNVFGVTIKEELSTIVFMRKMPLELKALFWTQLYGAMNDNFFKSALVVLVTYQNVTLWGMHSETLVALAGGIFIFPYFFSSASSGQLADSMDKIWLAHRIKEAELVIAFLGAVGIVFHSYFLMLIVLFLLGLQAAIFGPIKYSLIPSYVPKDQLVFGNALISAGTFVAILIGTIMGGVAASFQKTWVLILPLLTIAFLGLHYAKKLPLTPKDEDEEDEKTAQVDWNFYRASKETLSLVLKEREVTYLILGLSWFWFMGAGLLSLLPLIAKKTFHGNELTATMMLFIFTLGMGSGPFLLEKITKGKVAAWFIPVSLLAMTLILFDFSFAIREASKNSFLLMLANPLGPKEFFGVSGSTRVMMDLFLLSFFGGMFTVPQFAQLQRITPKNELARVVAGNNIVNAGAMVAVSVLLMFLHQAHFSFSLIMGVLGVLSVVMCVVLAYFYRESFNEWWKF